MKRFLRKHGFMATDGDVLTIIRRMDLDADARLTKQEFFSAIKPDEPYSKVMKRKTINDEKKRSRENTPTFNRSRSTSQHLRTDSLIKMTDNQKDNLRIIALDRNITK